ncbi:MULTISPECIES: AbrB/MazE/SpoVT family DNA-binding domain-containing protein [Bacillus]|uniref:AbrB/MazE/SpoVT family DNA-binding domain-containing protein n=1 Tax=Bacillus TaxID=1386 RepID=UPI000992532F|nr:AbrB/MazE/SpoVT family DNA-binding domain-containing protein [Bacillus pseudomycoides]MED1478181.1 AbrB/MazE/SpoVT family DNA-binding domain-containing protein [Bacillus pseudomycoides]OOR54376.1 AbrB family transcriptional regulator [Bacillus pseudomycoides]PEO45595.1 AbrB/MazE/SpoVT family DNA-binding domain-containing protein [Bacillus pseudomycoides]
MKNTGIVRKVDELGRVVIPIEMRRTLGIVEGSPMEFHVDNQDIVLRKHEKACLVTGELSEDNVELLGGRIALSREGAEVVMDLILQKGKEKGWLGK